MNNTSSPYDLLKILLENDHELDWALATVVFKQGSSYRAPGALMLLNSMGQTYGLVSGGCLESDIMLRSKRVFVDGNAEYVEYDMLDENSFAADLGIGCNGKVGILIQLITPQFKEVLAVLHQRMTTGLASRLLQVYHGADHHPLKTLVLLDNNGEWVASSDNSNEFPALSAEHLATDHTNFQDQGLSYSLSLIAAPINLWVFGGGADAQPLVCMAAQLGWCVTVVDHRPAYARPSEFKQARRVLPILPEALRTASAQWPKMDAAVLMTHNLELDASWLDAIYQHGAPSYVGLLGPRDRKQRVGELLQRANARWFNDQVHGPAGLNLGGELPESIALSILSQCHQVLFNVVD